MANNKTRALNQLLKPMHHKRRAEINRLLWDLSFEAQMLNYKESE